MDKDDNTIPYKAPIHHLRRLGCFVSSRISAAQRRGKLGPRSKPGYMMVGCVNDSTTTWKVLQAAIVQGTMLYASELTWNGLDKVEGPYQLAINMMASATLEVHQSISWGIITAERGFMPARALLDHRRACYAQRLSASPQGGQGHANRPASPSSLLGIGSTQRLTFGTLRIAASQIATTEMATRPHTRPQ